MSRVPDAHFEARYQADADPWRLEPRWYERRKRALTVAGLQRERYRRAFEPGCALGLLTVILARRCADVIAVDASATAAVAAAQRTEGLPNVTVGRLSVPDEWPQGRFDLILLSELGYYLDRPTMARLRDGAVARLTDDGELLAVHYRPAVEEHILDGDQVHDILRAASGVRHVLHHVEEHFRMDAFMRNGMA